VKATATRIAQAGSLGALTAVATLGLAWSTSVTAPRIDHARRADLQATLSQVIPENLHDNSLLDDSLRIAGDEYYLARKEEQLTAVAFSASEVGYSGTIELLIGVRPNGTIIGVRVTAHTETPGLGDRIEFTKSDWITAFDGRSLTSPGPSGWAVKKDGGDFDALTGATITPRAVVKAVHDGLVRFADVEQQLAGGGKANEEKQP